MALVSPAGLVARAALPGRDHRASHHRRDRAVYEAQFLLVALNFLFSTLASVLVAILIGSSYMARGATFFFTLPSEVPIIAESPW
jgi:hypothetical protein